MSTLCQLCAGDGKNHTGRVMRVNNEWCPRCGGYGTVPDDYGNVAAVTEEDLRYMRCNGLEEAA